MAGTGSLPMWARAEWARDLQRRDRAEAVADDLAGHVSRLVGLIVQMGSGGWHPEQIDEARAALSRHAHSCEQRRAAP